MNKPLDYYLGLPYTIELREDSEAGWFVKVKELPGCMSQGDTPEEALQMIREAMELWLEVALEDGDPIPEPRALDDYSGKFVLRVPRSLHRDLVEEAKCQGVSLNQYVSVALSRATSRSAPVRPTRAEVVPWPGLNASVRQVLLAAGLTEEVGELAEELFSSHMDRLLSQVESALQGAYYRDALWSIETLAQTLLPAIQKSHVMRIFFRAVTLLRGQAELVCELRQGLVDEAMQRSRVADAVRRSPVASQATRALSSSYLQAALEISSHEEHPPEPDFERLLDVSEDMFRW